MIKLLNKFKNAVAIKIEGDVTANDYDNIIPILEKKIASEGKINMYCEIDLLEKVEPGAFWKDLKFDIKHHDDFKKVALVGQKAWLKRMSKFTDPFINAKVKYFDNQQKAEALKWITA